MTGALRRTITTVVALATAAVLAGCGGGTTPPPAGGGGVGPSTGSTPSTTVSRPVAATFVMVIRHGEKPDDEQSGPGLDANGNEDESSLTQVGWDRAHGLADLFETASAARAGLARPSRIYAAGANDDGEGARTRETVKPLADRLGITVDTEFGKGDEEELVDRVLARPGPALISWQHSGIPSIAEAFGSVTPTPPSEWPEDRFDVVWTFTKTADGWRFAQLPELVLPQDQTGVIDD